MKEFITSHKVFLTPISPIHIGCGEDFEPTNYVIDDKVLYHFEPSNANEQLSDRQREELLNKSNRFDLLAIQRFFADNRRQFTDVAHYFVNVSENLEKIWHDKVGNIAQREKNGNIVLAKFAIERTAYLPIENTPYIPGSSFKGALTTPFLNKQHVKKGSPIVSAHNSKALVKEYIGEFQESKFRTVKFGDFIPTDTAHSQVYYALNFKKEPSKQGGSGRGIPLRRECILQGQYRAFQSEVALWENKNNTLTIQDYFSLLNEYYLPIFVKECAILRERTLLNEQWFKTIGNLLMNNKQLALVRLGKSGADSKVYQGKGVAQIKIMRGKQKPDFKDQATTLWLAGHFERQERNLLPFGWALLETDGLENKELSDWCKQQLTQYRLFDKTIILQQQVERKTKLTAQRLAKEAEKQAKLAQQQAEQAAKEALLNSASENQLRVIQLVEKIQSTSERQMDISGSILLKESLILLESATSWVEQDKSYLKENLTIDLIKSKVDFKKKDTDKNIKKAFNKLG